MAKISKEEWIKAGIKLLRKESNASIKIDILCEKLKISKGSFYHHFKNINEYIEALVKYNFERSTKSIIEGSQDMDQSIEKLESLRLFVQHLDPKIEIGLRAWSTHHPIVDKYQKKIDKVRMDYLYELILGLGTSKAKAKKYAKIQYAIFVGLMNLKALNSKENMEELVFLYDEIIKHSK